MAATTTRETPRPCQPPLPTGLLVELVSPMAADGRLARQDLRRLVAQVLPVAAGVVAGSLEVGEALAWDPAQRQELLRELLADWPPPVPLFFCITAASAAATRDLALALEEVLAASTLPPPVLWLDVPLIYHSNRGLPQYYRELQAGLTRPLVLWNQPEMVRRRRPAFKHANLRTAVVKKLAALPGVAALIFHGSLRRFLHYHAAAAGRPEFVLYEAEEERFFLRPGSQGVVSPGAQLFPQLWHQVTRACLFLQELEPQRLWQWSQLILKLQRAYRPYPAALLKAALQQLGLLHASAVLPSTPQPPAPVQEAFLELVRQVQAELAAVRP